MSKTTRPGRALQGRLLFFFSLLPPSPSTRLPDTPPAGPSLRRTRPASACPATGVTFPCESRRRPSRAEEAEWGSMRRAGLGAASAGRVSPIEVFVPRQAPASQSHPGRFGLRGNHHHNHRRRCCRCRCSRSRPGRHLTLACWDGLRRLRRRRCSARATQSGKRRGRRRRRRRRRRRAAPLAAPPRSASLAARGGPAGRARLSRGPSEVGDRTQKALPWCTAEAWAPWCLEGSGS